MANQIFIRVKSLEDWISVLKKLFSQGKCWDRGDPLSHEEYWLEYKEYTVLVVNGVEKVDELAYMSIVYFYKYYGAANDLITSEEFLGKNKIEASKFLGNNTSLLTEKSIDGIILEDGTTLDYRGKCDEEEHDDPFFALKPSYWPKSECQKTLELKDLKVGGIYKIAPGSEKKCREFVNCGGKYIRITCVYGIPKNFSYDILNGEEEQIGECLACFKPEDLISNNKKLMAPNGMGFNPLKQLTAQWSAQWPYVRTTKNGADITIFDELGNFNSNNKKTMAKKLTAKIRRLFSNDERKLFQAGYYDECRSLTSKGRETLQLIVEDKFKEDLMKEAENDLKDCDDDDTDIDE